METPEKSDEVIYNLTTEQLLGKLSSLQSFRQDFKVANIECKKEGDEFLLYMSVDGVEYELSLEEGGLVKSSKYCVETSVTFEDARHAFLMGLMYILTKI